MAYYRIKMTGGSDEERAKFTAHMGYSAKDQEAAREVFYLNHSAALAVIQRAYQSMVGPNLVIGVEKISGDDYRMRK